MQGLLDGDRDLRGASLEELRQILQELIRELRFRFSTISAENFTPEDLPDLATALLDTLTLEIRDGKIVYTKR